jgi:hypothetical protein
VREGDAQVLALGVDGRGIRRAEGRERVVELAARRRRAELREVVAGLAARLRDLALRVVDDALLERVDGGVRAERPAVREARQAAADLRGDLLVDLAQVGAERRDARPLSVRQLRERRSGKREDEEGRGRTQGVGVVSSSASPKSERGQAFFPGPCLRGRADPRRTTKTGSSLYRRPEKPVKEKRPPSPGGGSAAESPARPALDSLPCPSDAFLLVGPGERLIARLRTAVRMIHDRLRPWMRP